MNAKRQNLLTNFLQGILITSLIGLTAVLFAPVQRNVSERMARLHQEAVTRIEQQLGRSFSYERISPSILSRFTIRGVTIGSIHGPDPLLELEALSVRYAILPLLFGQPEQAIRGVRVQNTSIFVDTRIDTELVELLTGSRAEGESSTGDTFGLVQAIPDGIVVSGRNLTVTVQDELGQIRMSRLRFDAAQGQNGLDVDARFNLDGHTSLWAELGPVEAQVRLEGGFDTSFGNVTALLDIRSFTSSLFRLNRQQFRLQAGSERVEIRKVEDDAPVDVAVLLTPDSVAASLVADTYQLSQLVRLEGAWSVIDPWLASTVTGSARFSWDRLSGADYEADFSAGVPEDRIQGGLEFDLRTYGDLSEARIPTLRVATPYGRFLFSGSLSLETLLPTGSLYLDRVALAGGPPLSASVSLSEDNGASVIESAGILYAGVSISDLSGRIQRTGSRIQTDVSARIANPGTIRIRADLDLQSLADARATALLSNISVPEAVLPLVAAFTDRPVPEPLADLLQTTRLSGHANWRGLQPDRWSGDAQVRLSDSLYSDRSARVDAQVRGQDLRGQVDLRLPDIVLTGEYVLRPARTALLGLDSRLTVQGVEYELRAMLGPEYLSVTGGPGIQADAFFPSGQPVSASFRLRDIALPTTAFTDEGTRLSTDLQAVFTDEDDWRITLRSLEAENLIVPWLETSDLSAQGRVDSGGAILDRLRLTDQFGSIEAAAILQWDGTNGFTIDAVADNPADSSERYEIQLSVGDSVDGRVQLRGADLRRARVETLVGAADASVDVSGRAGNILLSGDISTRDAVFDGEELSLQTRFSLGSDEVSFRDLSAAYIGISIEDGTARVSTVDSRIEANLDTRVPLGGDIYPVRVEIAGNLDSETDAEHDGDAGLLTQDFDLSVRLAGTPAFADLPDVWEFDLARRAGRLSVIGGPDESVAIVVEPSGEFFMTLGTPLPLSLEADGSFSAGEVELNLTGIDLDVASLPGVFDFDGAAIISGRASGSLRMLGPITDPDFFGTIPVTNFEMTVDQLPDTIGPANGFLVFSEKEMRIHPIRVPIGQATADASGFFLISRWNIEQFELQIATVGQPGVRFVEDFDGFMVDGFGQGTISIIDNGADLLLSGSLTAHNTTMTLGPVDEEPDEPTPERDNPLLVDLTITAGRSVEFLWPTTQLPILRAVSAPGARVQIQADTVRNTFALTGDVATQGGELFYLDRTFLIREGLIRFNETQENVDPRLTLRAETRDIGPDGPVRISIIAEESPLSELTVRAVSDPPLSEEDLLVIFGGGVFATGDSLVSLSGAVLAGTELVGQFGLIRRAEAGIRSALQLDLFSVRTQLFQNLVRGVIDDPTDDPDEAAIPSLGRVFNNTTVFLGRSLGPDVFAELLVQFRARSPFDDASERAFAGIDIDSEFSLEFETPFFDLQWSFFPRTPGALFVPDNQFTFSWGFSY